MFCALFALLSVTITATQNPIVWYKFNETSGATAADSSGFGKNGTLNGTTAWVSGKIFNAVDLNGANGYVSMSASVVGSLNDFTVAT